jgi:hypothetical protein
MKGEQMKICPNCRTELIVKDYDPTNTVYAPADYCPECDMFLETPEDYKTKRAWKKVLKWGLIIVGISWFIKFIF